MADNRLTRQQIYDRIRESSKDEYILEEMKRLGFWKKNESTPSIPELLIKKESSLQKELNALVAEKQKYHNREALLKEMRMKRMEESKQKREENKKKKEKERFDKAEAWRIKQETEIYYLGEEVSAGLHFTENNYDLLRQKALPIFENESQLALAMGITVKELAFLAYSRKVSEVTHYQKFYLPKKSGGKRLISAPMPRLKSCQHWILQNILYKIPLHADANGFVPGKSILTNAQPHVGKQVVINADVKDFFPSIHFKRVRALFKKIGYADKIATILALICTEAPTDNVQLDGKKYFVQKGERVLPQGAPTSPAITNILCYRLDKRLTGVAKKFNCNYTRYADDITYSGPLENNTATKLIWHIRKILTEEGFTLHPDKVRIMQKSQRQEVTGIVVNQQLSISREKLRKFRALLHQLSKNGHEKLVWNTSSLPGGIEGFAAFVKMVNPGKGNKIAAEMQTIKQTSQWKSLINKKEAIAKPQKPPFKDSPDPDDWFKVV